MADAPRPADPEPIAVVFLEEGSSGGGGSRGGRGTATTLAAASTGTAHGEETPAPARPVAPSPWMVMRHPDLKGPSEDFMRKFEENTRPIPVRPSVMGSKEKEDIAAISRKLNDPDYVEFADPTALGNLRILREQKREEVAAAELHPSGNGTYATHPREDEQYTMHVARDGSATFVDKPNFQMKTPFLFTFDLTDWGLRAHGTDPYGPAKQALLDRTFEQRAEIGRQYHEELIGHTAVLMQQNLTALWAKVQDPWARKEALFQLWDECIETGDDAAAANGARRQVLAFIAAKKLAYSPDELARLNAKRASASPFHPPSQ